MSQQFTDEDRELLAKAAGHRSADPSAETLSQISARDGIDLATAVLFDWLSRKNADFIERVNRSPGCTSGASVQIVVVPGAFHQHHSNTGADGQRVFKLAKQLGWNFSRVPVRSLASLSENAEVLSQFLQSTQADRIILVSLSKGGADVRAMLALPDAVEATRRVIAWISLSGMVTGTPLIDWLRSQRLRYLGARCLLALRGQSFLPLAELSRDQFPKDWPAIPPHLKVIHVLGFPLARHLCHPWAHRGYARLAPLGPNDGGGILLGDAINFPGSIYPVWGADHYLQPRWDLSSLLMKVFQEAAAV